MPRWTTESRLKHSQLMQEKIREWQPWQYSTGARTEVGKAISRKNALKHGQYSAETKALYKRCMQQLRQAKSVLDMFS